MIYKTRPYTPPTILKNLNLQAHLNAKGYAMLGSLTKSALFELQLFFKEVHSILPKGPIPGFYISAHSSDFNYKMRCDTFIKKTIHPFLELSLANYKCPVACIQVKCGGNTGMLGVHQDWNGADETLYTSYGLWIPLIDIDPFNGALHILAGSHLIYPTYRHASIPSPFETFTDDLLNQFEPIYAKAGEVILFDQSILHYSPNNITETPRPSVVATIIPQAASYIMYYQSPTNKSQVEMYEVPDNYLLSYGDFFSECFLPPKGALFVKKDAAYIKEKISPDNLSSLLHHLK